METTRPPGFPGNPPARMPRAPTPARSPPPRPLRCGEIAFRPTHDVGPHKQCISGLNHAAYGLPVNASRPGSPQAHASLGSGWRPTLAGWDWIPTGFRTRFQRSHHGILSPLTGLSRHTRCCMVRPRNHATTPCRATTEHLAVRAKRSASTVRTHQRTLITRSLIETDTRKGGRESTRWRVMLPAEGNSDHRAGQQKLLGRPTETVAEGREGIEGTSEKSTYVRTNGRKNRRTNRPYRQFSCPFLHKSAG